MSGAGDDSGGSGYYYSAGVGGGPGRGDGQDGEEGEKKVFHGCCRNVGNDLMPSVDAAEYL